MRYKLLKTEKLSMQSEFRRAVRRSSLELQKFDPNIKPQGKMKLKYSPLNRDASREDLNLFIDNT